MWNAYIVMTNSGITDIDEDAWTMLAVYQKGLTYDGKTAYRAAKDKVKEIAGIWTHAKVIKAVVLQIFNA